jgi:2,4-dienoyl-CoA reductase (NADPH2)
LLVGSDVQVTRKGVRFTSADGTDREIQADTIVPTAPVAADRRLAEQLQGKIPEVFAVGDCRESGLMVDAVADAWKAARAI